MRTVFFGSPPFGVTVLRHLVDAGVDVVAVVSQPDKPAGRGNTLVSPAAAVFARASGMALHQPTKVRDGALAAWLRSLRADVAIVAAYGRILTQEVLDAPRLGCVNVHASLLPRWRGASPIARAIAAGDAQTGVCLMQMDAGLDTGPVLARAELLLGDGDTTPDVEARLAELGGRLLVDCWAGLTAGRLQARPQDHAVATFAPPLRKDDGCLDLSRAAQHLHAQVRAMQPWPGALFATVLGEDWKVGAGGLLWDDAQAAVGRIAAMDRDRVWLGCGAGRLGIAQLQRPNKAKAPAPDVLRGVRLGVGEALWAGTA
ncbi:MAG: methionyl-tRNA formyltransferase [Deltaproteobacteria bacterium]|nr:methionyl-tRNA formyltransferase [Deltaproteobacteria bacterium]